MNTASTILLLTAALTVPTVPVPAQSDDPASVTWRDEQVEPSAFSGDADLEAAIETWGEFATERGYRMLLSDDQRVLVLVEGKYRRRSRREEHPKVRRTLELIGEACAATEPFRAFPDDAPPTAVVLVLDSDDYEVALARVAHMDHRLANWARDTGRSTAGFMLSEPLVGSLLVDPSGVEEWNPDNELVHRTAQLLIRAETPKLPGWLMLGLAWHVEELVLDSLYCFPHRTGFVSASSHTGWGDRLAREFSRTRRRRAGLDPVLQPDEFAAWDPMTDDGFTTGQAYLAFGLARFLAIEHAASLGSLRRTLDVETREGQKRWTSATTWTTDPLWQLPVERQAELLAGIDESLLADATRFFARKKVDDVDRPQRSRARRTARSSRRR